MPTLPQHGVHGYAGAKATHNATPAKKKVHAEPIPELVDALTPSERKALELAGITFSMTSDGNGWRNDKVTDETLRSLVASLEHIVAKMQDWDKPVTRDQLIKGLGDFADMLQVSTPEAGGVDLYLSALSTMPSVAWNQALIRLARTHRYSRLPLPQDFLHAVQPELEWLFQQKSWPTFLLSHLKRLQDARAFAQRNL